MLIRDVLKIIITFYVSAVLIYILLHIGSGEGLYFFNAFLPARLYEKFVSRPEGILYTLLLFIFIIKFNFLRRLKIDYWTGRAWPWKGEGERPFEKEK